MISREETTHRRLVRDSVMLLLSLSQKLNTIRQRSFQSKTIWDVNTLTIFWTAYKTCSLRTIPRHYYRAPSNGIYNAENEFRPEQIMQQTDGEDGELCVNVRRSRPYIFTIKTNGKRGHLEKSRMAHS